MDKLLEIQGLLEPISEQDWHGKWRIQKVLDICRNKQSVCSDHGNNLRCPKCDPSSPFVAGLAKLSIKHSLPHTLDPTEQRRANSVLRDEIDAIPSKNSVVTHFEY